MNHSERVLKSLQHREPDRVRIDFGGTLLAGIAPVPYRELKAHLGLEIGLIRVLVALDQVALVENEVQVRLGSDVRGSSSSPRRGGVLNDGSPAEFPSKCKTEARPDGSEVVLDEEGDIEVVRAPGSRFYMPRSYRHAPLSAVISLSDVDKWRKKMEPSSLVRPGFRGIELQSEIPVREH